ncbi:FkbM family methyltransferase [Oscillatoria amoena NRMC-F 0135]|nr:FkbM family methyltransferase [Oscillatoria amoena NRMC-F 0135]
MLKLLSSLRLLSPARKLSSFFKKASRQNISLKTLYTSFLTDHDLFFDIGANEGVVTNLVASMGCRVVAVEANPELAGKIKKRFSSASTVMIEHAAVSSSVGSVEFLISDEMPELSSVSKEWVDKSVYAGACRWNRTVTVPALTLDALIEKHGMPRFIKIDVEGHEPDVLAGLTQAVDYLSFEYCLKMEGALEACVQRLEQIAADSNRRALFNYSKDKNHSLELRTWVSGAEILRKLHSFDDELAVGDIYCKTISETI